MNPEVKVVIPSLDEPIRGLGSREANIEYLRLIKERLVQVKAEQHRLAVGRELLAQQVKRPDGYYKRDQSRRDRQNTESKANATLHCSRWDESDDAFILKNMGKMTRKELARHLGRTHFAIKRRVSVLNSENTKVSDAEHSED